MSVGLNEILVASAALLGIGAFGIVCGRSLVTTLLGAQFILISGAIAFVAFGRFGLGAENQTGAATMAMFVGATAVAELAVGGAVARILYRERRSLALDEESG